jgi:hypothetical protein
MILRRANSPTWCDLLWVRWSFVPLLLFAMYVAGLLGR